MTRLVTYRCPVCKQPRPSPTGPAVITCPHTINGKHKDVLCIEDKEAA